MKPVVDELIANKTINDAGLQGRTIAPKNRPKIKELNIGFFLMGALTLGKNFPISKLNIIKILIIPSIANAIGLIISIALVKESWSKNVNINPKIKIEIDGGINNKTINKAKKYADIFVVGSYVQNTKDSKEAIKELERLANN